MARAPGRRDVERELARARGSRRMLPWSVATAAGGGALALAAGLGLRAAAVLFALGLVFAAFLWSTSIPRCPACGAPLPRPKGPGPQGTGPAGERVASCPRCHVRFD